MEGLSNGPGQPFTSAGTEVVQGPESTGSEQRCPRHPIPQLQGPFEESISEALSGPQNEWAVNLDAQSRRRDLLENPQYERLCGRKWRQRADERYHPFWKLTAQMSFGLHLLAKGTAKSNAAVLRILQAHVDEVDGFISRTTEDFLIIQVDLRTRIQYLSLPLENLDMFDEMLEDRHFRLAMIDYNGKIELAIERFTAAVNDSLKDIQKGREAIGGLWQYIGQSTKENDPLPSSLVAVYNSMLANTEGWNTTFSKLRRKGVALQHALSQLGRAVTEMQRRVGVASRKDMMSFVQASRRRPRAKSLKGIFDRRMSVATTSQLAAEKPLPCEPASGNESGSRLPRASETRKLAQKSVPNLVTVKEYEICQINDKASIRAKSLNGATSSDLGSGAILPRIPKTISRRFSRARLTTKSSAEEATEDMPTRPSTAPSRTLKSLRKNIHGPQQQQKQQEHPPDPPMPTQPRRPGTSNASARRETMKNQLLQYFKSDRVLDAWESATQKEKTPDRPSSQRKKDGGLWSKFYAKSSGTQSDELQANVFQDDLRKQMAWLEEETKTLSTYTLKPKHDVAPRIPTFLDNMSLHQQLDEQESHYAGVISELDDADAQSIITALPAFPLPPVTSLAPQL